MTLFSAQKNRSRQYGGKNFFTAEYMSYEVEQNYRDIPTLYEGTTSLIGLNLWFSCCSEVKHTKHAGSLSSRQKSLSFSLCKLQISSDPDERLSFLSFRNDSHKFCNARFNGGQSFEDLLLQTGHSWVFLVLQNCWRHSLQTLWLHDKITGVLKISQHTGQL